MTGPGATGPGATGPAALPLAPPPLVPELRLHVARDSAGVDALWDATGDVPYWAVAWPGGVALARHLLDHPTLVRGRRVLDVGTGTGLVAIAAARCGAAAVVAVDVDPLAVTAAAANARANGVDVDARLADVLDGDGTVAAPPGVPADVVLVGDLLYEAATAPRVVAFVQRCAARGADVLVGDPGRRYLPRAARAGWEPLATYPVPVSSGLEGADEKPATVWRVRRLPPSGQSRS